MTGIHLAAGKMSLTITGSTLLANVTGSTSALILLELIDLRDTRTLTPTAQPAVWDVWLMLTMHQGALRLRTQGALRSRRAW